MNTDYRIANELAARTAALPDGEGGEDVLTTICAYVDGKSVWLGSDRQQTVGQNRHTGRHKWFIRESAAIGVTGSGRAFSIIEWNLTRILAALGPQNVWERLTTILGANGCEPEQVEGEMFRRYPASFLYAWNGQLWDVDGYGAFISISEFWARGSGSEFALGAFQALRQHKRTWGLAPESIVTSCIEAASVYDTGSSGKPWVHEMKA